MDRLSTNLTTIRTSEEHANRPNLTRLTRSAHGTLELL